MVSCGTSSPEETRAVAALVARVVGEGSMLCLDGDLGAGKTTFVQGLCQELGVREPVASPTFVLLRVYHGRLPVYHFDAYRLDHASQLDDLGAEEYFWGDGVSVLEWAERVVEALPDDRLDIRIITVGETERRLRVEARGPSHGEMLERLRALLPEAVPEPEPGGGPS